MKGHNRALSGALAVRVALRGLRPWHVCTDSTATQETLFVLPRRGEGAGNCNRKEAFIRDRESDYFVVLKMAGNAAGRKEVRHGHA